MLPPEVVAPGPTRLASWLARLICLVLALAVTVADVFTSGDVIIPFLFAVPLAFAAASRDARFLWLVTGVTIILTIGLNFWGRGVAHPDMVLAALVNRLLASISLVSIAGAFHLWMRAEQALEAQRLLREKQNEELETINAELSQREEEIVRQNEELQSQTEELERQSEELRVTNEELASREKMLEQMLELARSLTSELNRDEMLRKICEALGVLTEGLPSAILEKHDDVLTIPCHHAFGPDGLESESIPFSRSFTSLIMSLGQTGFLEDAKLRPELILPTPRGGDPPRSVLAAPLRVHGRCVGAIEVYSRTPQSWSELQITLLESLAAQASISLQNAELIETIRQERRRFEAAFRTVPFGLAVIEDPEGKEIRLNPAGAALFGVPLDENVSLTTPAGARLRRAFSRGGLPLAEEQLPFTRVLRGEEVQGEELDLMTPPGRHLALLASGAPVYDARGRVRGGVVAFADVTALKNLQRELDLRRREAEEASVRKTRFLAAVSHDIRTPVNAINLMAEVLRRAADTPALAGQIAPMAQRLQANALALADLVTDVLDLARFDTGKMELQESEFSLADLIEEERLHLLPLAQDKKLELVFELPDRPIWLRTDRVKLARVIGNLVGNAIKFTERGRIAIRARLGPERDVWIQVQDTGIGIPAEQLARIFDEFAQLRNPERDREKGTGLGLAICKRLAEIMGGTVSVESQVGHGSTFTVRLPASCVLLRLTASTEPGTAAGKAKRSNGPRGKLSGLRALLVEDHPATRESTAQLLREEGVNLQEAANGAEALRLLGEGPHEVLLLDMMLPDMDGREILKSIAARRPVGLKAVIVTTGDLTSERMAEVRQLGADAVLGKPIDVDKLLDMLQSIRNPTAGAG